MASSIPSWKFPSSVGISMRGYSRAGKATAFYIPELNWNLDAGYAELLKENPRPEYIFITHGHADHSFMLPYLWMSKDPTKVLCPEPLVQFVKNYASSAAQLNNCDAEIPSNNPAVTLDVNGVSNGACLLMTTANKRNFVVKVIDCDHTVPSVGFCFSEKRKKLRDEYKALPGKEIGKLIKEGIDVNVETEIPMFVFLGDTTTKVFEMHPSILEYPVVIVECTILHSDHKDSAPKSGHVYWGDLEPIVASHPQTTFVLIHFSMRYTRKNVAEFFEPIKERLPNIHVWLESDT
eukprot:TRINITY_DN13303_c0_g1_i1.p1 TRINITY_DN13303_c0_g1~~TRINITY_DN13303_c0_g1_i1.p1  ORF type:complete len:292 (+),score=61.21 TRINITY_DN13303_c0_g1_i1:49-924(+)